jgi:heat shock protein HslJ
MRAQRLILVWPAFLAGLLTGCAHGRPQPAPEALPPSTPAGSPANQEPPTRMTYTCEDGQKIDVTYSPGEAVVAYQGREFRMRHTESASGAAYTDEEYAWHTKGDAGLLREVKGDRTVAKDCRPSSGTSAASASALPPDVVDITWQWVSLTTPVERLTVDAPERYTLRFEGSGRVTVRSDCNRGAGTYTVASDRRITLNAIALTRMMCPPGSLSGRFEKDVGRVSSYFLKDGDSFLEMPVESGTLRFRRQP